MFTEPPDLDRAALAEALEHEWRIPAPRLEYLSLGFGSHHWQALAADGSRWFVSADDLEVRRFPVLDRAFRTAAALRDAGLEFVSAPLPSADGTVLARIGARYTVRVEAYIDGVAGQDGEFEHARDRRAVGTLVGRLHAASTAIPDGLPGREDFALPRRAALEQALAELDAPWGAGPFGEPARTLLREHADRVQERLSAYDRVAARVREGSGSWVVTHGEPHNANVVRAPSGELHLVDWDTVMTGPRERDLWMVLDADLTGLEQYRKTVGPVALDEPALALYRQRWALAEICEYIAQFRRPHDETEDTRLAWHELGEYLP